MPALVPVLLALHGIESPEQKVTLHDIPFDRSAICDRNMTLHLIRHAEGWHNKDELEAEAARTAGHVWRDLDFDSDTNMALRAEHGVPWMLLERVTGRNYHDPHLTPTGREQALALRKQLRTDASFNVDAVAVSPMRRTIMTALLGLPALEAAATTFALASAEEAAAPKALPILASDLLRERVGPFMPDSRLTRSELARAFGNLGGGVEIDFSAVSEADAMFAEGRERHEPEVGSQVLAERASGALRWLASLSDVHRSVAVVSHKHFLAALTGLHPDHVTQRPFDNAERRTLLLCAQHAEAPMKPVRARVKTMGKTDTTIL
jgi:broad specificity phosphatase PhoE